MLPQLCVWSNLLVLLGGTCLWGATVGCGRGCRSHGPTGQLHCALFDKRDAVGVLCFSLSVQPARSAVELRPVFAGFRFTLHNCTSPNRAWDAGHLLDHIEDVESLGSLS